MTRWITKINLYDITQREGEETPNEVLKTAQDIQNEIKSNTFASIRLGNLASELVKKTKKAVDAEFDYETCCDIFNGILSKIYDKADIERIWTAG